MKTNTKPQRALLTLIVIALSIFLASCASAQPTDPIEIIQTANDRFNEGDLDGFMEFFADDAVMADEQGRFVGTQAIREYMRKEIVGRGMRFEVSDLSVDGNVVTYTCHVFKYDNELDTYKGLDVIKNGQIIFEGSEEVYRSECERDPSQAFCPTQ